MSIIWCYLVPVFPATTPTTKNRGEKHRLIYVLKWGFRDDDQIGVLFYYQQ